MSGDRAGNETFVYMDAMRFMAACLVVLNHVRDLYLIDLPQINHPSISVKLLYLVAGFGHQSVMVFFVLSGFWITGAVVRRDKWPLFWREFLIDRLSRLWVVVLPALLLGGALDWFGVHFLSSFSYTPFTGAHSMVNVLSHLSFPTFMGNLVFIQGLFVPTFGSNGPLWSLAFEFWYYVWFPALWLATKRRWSVGLVSLPLALIFPGLGAGYICWLVGSALYLAIYMAKNNQIHLSRRQAWPVLASSTTILVLTLIYSRIRNNNGWTDLGVSGMFALVLFSLYAIGPSTSKIVSAMAKYGAASSFSLYAIHYPIAAFTIALIAPHGRQTPGFVTVATILVLMVGLVGAGWAFSKGTEAKTQTVRALLRRAIAPQAGGNRTAQKRGTSA